MLHIAEEGDVYDLVGWTLAGEEVCGIDRPRLALVSKDKCATFVRSREDDDKGAEHGVALRRVPVWLEERALSYEGMLKLVPHRACQCRAAHSP